MTKNFADVMRQARTKPCSQPESQFNAQGRLSAVLAAPKRRSDATAPSSAFWLDSQSPLAQFRASGQEPTPVELLARTGDAIPHYFWGSIAHDFDGMRHRGSIPIDYEHNTSDPIGYIDRFEVRDGDLYLLGWLVPGELAESLGRKSQAGIPFQASIFFDSETAEFEEVRERQFASANGRSVRGPAVIARSWDLRGVAITPHGKDIGTEAKFSYGDSGQTHKLKILPQFADLFRRDVSQGR